MIRALAIASFVCIVPCFFGCGTSATVPNCQGDGAGKVSDACSSCLTTNCATQVSDVDSACDALATCIEACKCSDTTCLSGCTSKATSTCQPKLSALGTCQAKSCATACM